MKSRTIIILAVVVGALSWAVLGLADFNAEYLMELNSPSGNRPAWLDFARMNKPRLWESLHLSGLFVCLMPVLSMLLLSDSKRGALSVLSIVVLLFLADVYQLLAFEGGDRKGCEGCFGLFVLHAVFGISSLTLVCLYFFARHAFGANSIFRR